MAANAASTRIWPIVESSTAFLSGCRPGGRARFRLDMEEHRSRYAQRNRITPSRGGPSRKVIPCGAPARMSRSPWTKEALMWRNYLSVRHVAFYRVPSDFCRPARCASDQGHIVALSYTLSRDTTKKGTIQKLHQPVHPIAGAMRFWVIIDLTELIAFASQIQGMALHHAVRQCRLGPCPQAPQTMGKSPFARSVIRFPHPILH